MFLGHFARPTRSIFFLVILGWVTVSCGSKNDDSKKELSLALGIAAQNDKIGESLSSAFDSVASSMEGLSGEGAAVALYGQDPSYRERLTSSISKIWNKGPQWSSMEAYNFAFDCWGGGDYQRQTVSTGATNYDFIDYYLDNAHTPSSSFFVSKSFNNCRFLPFSSWVVDGVTENIWSGLSSSSPFVQVGTTLQIGVNRTLKNSTRDRTILVAGTGADLSYGAGTPSTKQAYSLTWTPILTGAAPGVSSYSQEVSVLREGYSGADLVYSHSVTTPTSLQYGVDRSDSDPLSWYRLWSAGSIQVVHVEDNYTLTTSVETPVKWKYVDCLPRSGKVSFTVTGDITGTGVVEFSNGTGYYTYTVSDVDGNNASASGSIDFSSCSVPLLIL